MAPLLDDLNTPGAIAGLHALADAALAGDADAAAGLLAAGTVLGLFNMTPEAWFRGDGDRAARSRQLDCASARRRAQARILPEPTEFVT